MSYSTAEILLRDGGFDLKCRGTISVKVRVNAIRYAQIIDYLQVAYVTTTVSFNCSAGKGAITTYWLQNADNFHLPLPDLSKAANESEHTFK